MIVLLFIKLLELQGLTMLGTKILLGVTTISITLILILVVNWQDSRLSITPITRFQLRRFNSVFLQLQFEASYTVNLLNAKWKDVPTRNSGWKKEYLYHTYLFRKFHASDIYVSVVEFTISSCFHIVDIHQK